MPEIELEPDVSIQGKHLHYEFQCCVSLWHNKCFPDFCPAVLMELVAGSRVNMSRGVHRTSCSKVIIAKGREIVPEYFISILGRNGSKTCDQQGLQSLHCKVKTFQT